jgi:hypothetical protein
LYSQYEKCPAELQATMLDNNQQWAAVPLYSGTRAWLVYTAAEQQCTFYPRWGLDQQFLPYSYPVPVQWAAATAAGAESLVLDVVAVHPAGDLAVYINTEWVPVTQFWVYDCIYAGQDLRQRPWAERQERAAQGSAVLAEAAANLSVCPAPHAYADKVRWLQSQPVPSWAFHDTTATYCTTTTRGRRAVRWTAPPLWQPLLVWLADLVHTAAGSYVQCVVPTEDGAAAVLCLVQPPAAALRSCLRQGRWHHTVVGRVAQVYVRDWDAEQGRYQTALWGSWCPEQVATQIPPLQQQLEQTAYIKDTSTATSTTVS